MTCALSCGFLPREKAGRIPALAPQILHFRIELIHQRGHRQADAIPSRFFQRDAQVLAHPFHGKAVIRYSPASHRLVRFSICQLCAAPLEITSTTPLRYPGPPRAHQAKGFGHALHDAGDADLIDHLGELSGTGRAQHAWPAGRIDRHHRFGLGISGFGVPPHMMPSLPLTAPAWPPETGASTKSKPRFVPLPASSRAMPAEAVVWSTNSAPLLHGAESAIGAQASLRAGRVAADAAEDDLLALAASAGVGGGVAAIFA